MRTVLTDPDRTDDFRLLDNELYLAATDLDTCERIVLGAEGWDDVPISLAVRASTALPMVYKPVKVQRPRAGRRRHRLDHEPRHRRRGGREVHRRRQPARALRQRLHAARSRRCWARRSRRVSDMGFPKIGYQTFKLLAYQRLHEMARQWEERYPGVDIVLIEPEPDDELMFQTNIMNFTSRLEVARHGFQSVTRQARRRLRAPARGRAAPRHRDLRDARAQGREALRGRAGEDARLAPDPRADDRRAAAPVRRRLTQALRVGPPSPRRGRRTGPRTSR